MSCRSHVGLGIKRRHLSLVIGHWSLAFGLWPWGLGPWGLGALGPWGLGALGPWDLGTLGPWDLGTLGPWDLGFVGFKLGLYRQIAAKTQDPRPKTQDPRTQDPRPTTQDPRPKAQDTSTGVVTINGINLTIDIDQTISLSNYFIVIRWNNDYIIVHVNY
jgi:hypothetical protein